MSTPDTRRAPVDPTLPRPGWAPASAPRFDGAAAWLRLPLPVRDELGPILLELLSAQRALDAAESGTPTERAAIAALDRLDGELMALLEDVMPAGFFYGAPAPLPSRLGQVCRNCGCSGRDACIDTVTGFACSRVEPGLCSQCAAAAAGWTGAADFGAEPHGEDPIISAGEAGDGGTGHAPDDLSHSGGADSTRPLQPLWGAT